MHAWTGKLLRVDLTAGSVAVEEIPRTQLQDYLGGRGLAVRYLMDEIDPQVEPLSPENKLIMASGPLTGTPIPTGARYMVVTKSPLTGALTCSNSGGFFPTEMKKAGFDMIIIEGKAAQPAYLFVEDGRAELRPADHLWGRIVPEADRILREETAESAKTAIIGPAGEKQVRIASIMNDKHRAAGRAGVGAVMGAKNLKAVVLREYGTAYMPPVTSGAGMCPTRNFQTGVFEGAEKISGLVLTDKYLVRPGACWGCPIACGRITRLDHERWQGQGEGPEYETLASLGSSCGVDELEAIIKANYLCNELGLDTISMGMTIGCAMELFEKGLLPREDVGRTLNFGDAEAMVALTEQTGLREGFGNQLAEGSYRLAQKYGHPEYSIT
ncbi:MAG: aldehyde ferredoxin oxidoreductase N-terminal domain-containing protein, partial [Desulfobacterales bacterium]